MRDDGARLVNRHGERFGDKRDRAAWRLPDLPGKIGWIVIDDRIARRYRAWPHFISTAPGIACAYQNDYRGNRPDVCTLLEKGHALRDLSSADNPSPAHTAWRLEVLHTALA